MISRSFITRRFVALGNILDSIVATISYVGVAASDNDSTVTSPVVNYPTVSVGDIMLCAIATSSVNTHLNAPPAGWTKIASANDPSNGSSTCVLWHRADGTEGATATWTDYFLGSPENAKFVVLAYSGCVATGSPIDTYQINQLTSASFDKTIGTITTTVANTLLVGIWGNDPLVTTGEFTFDQGTLRINTGTTPSGMMSSGQAALAAADGAQAAIGTPTWTGVATEEVPGVGILLALKPL